jgi:hypothetical protein
VAQLFRQKADSVDRMCHAIRAGTGDHRQFGVFTTEVNSMEDDKQSIKINYRSAQSYRVVHASGIHGGPLPSGEIFLSVFSERTNFPDSSVIQIEKDGSGFSGKEIVQIDKGLVREMEVGVLMNINVARALRQWLDEKIIFIERAMDDPNVPKNVMIAGGKGDIV